MYVYMHTHVYMQTHVYMYTQTHTKTCIRSFIENNRTVCPLYLFLIAVTNDVYVYRFLFLYSTWTSSGMNRNIIIKGGDIEDRTPFELPS